MDEEQFDLLMGARRFAKEDAARADTQSQGTRSLSLLLRNERRISSSEGAVRWNTRAFFVFNYSVAATRAR